MRGARRSPSQVRCAGLDEAAYTSGGEHVVGAHAARAAAGSALYRMAYGGGFGALRTAAEQPPGWDRVRGAEVRGAAPLGEWQEAYTTRHWLVRVYRLADAAAV